MHQKSQLRAECQWIMTEPGWKQKLKEADVYGKGDTNWRELLGWDFQEFVTD